jgi:membrane protein YdbS with pleckstrin-like domain
MADMGVAPNPESVPLIVARHLLPWERQTITIRYHPAVLLGPAAVTLVGLLAAALLSVLKSSADVRLAVWLVWLLILVYLLSRVWAWLESYYVVTTYRMMVIKGIFTRDAEMVPLSAATTLKLRRTAMGRLLGYGKFLLADIGQDPVVRVINYVPYPEQLYLEVCSLIYPGDEAN